MVPLTIVPWMVTPLIIAPRTIAPEEKWPPDNFPRGHFPPREIVPPSPWMIVPGSLLLEGNCLLTICPWKLPPVKTGFWMICCLHNYRSDKWSRGKLLSRKITARINYTRCIFSPRIRNISTLISSCFLLFSFFVV